MQRITFRGGKSALLLAALFTVMPTAHANGQGLLVTANPCEMVITPGSSDTSMIVVTSLSGFTGTLALTAGVSPSLANGPTAAISPPSVTLSPPTMPSATATLVVSTTLDTPIGNYTVAVSGSGAGVSGQTSVAVAVTDGPRFVRGKLSWIHHLFLSRDDNTQTWAAKVGNGGMGSVSARVRIVGMNDQGFTFTATSATFSLAPGELKLDIPVKFTFPNSVADTRFDFTAFVDYGATADNLSKTSPVTKSGSFAVVP